MGYPNFGKVKTITLPIPESSMTFEDYKNAFGIDLKQLGNAEFLLLKELSGEVVPVLYFDKENAVLYTANYSVDISDGFEVKSDSLISKVIANGTIENAKPIYCHPLTIYTRGTGIVLNGKQTTILATAMIFDNDSTVIDTLEKLVNRSKIFHRLQCNGVMYNTDDNIAIELMQLYADEESLRPVGVNLSTGLRIDELSSTYELWEKELTVVDGVNKIN